MGQQLTPPVSIADFKAQFPRDFTYGQGLDTVRDLDIQMAMNMAFSVFNPCLFSDEKIGVAPLITSEARIAYCYAVAHFLVTSIQTAGGLGATSPAKGVVSQGEGTVSSKSAGGVSVSYSWPDFIQNNGAMFGFTTTPYGVSYLQMLIPRLVGNVGLVAGANEAQPGSDPRAV